MKQVNKTELINEIEGIEEELRLRLRELRVDFWEKFHEVPTTKELTDFEEEVII